MRKLPYIQDKKLYAAVMGACSYIRNTGYFNKACHYYADKYDVPQEEIEKYVRIAQGNGQKASKEKRTYHWYALEWSLGNERNGVPYFEPYYAQYGVKKATSAHNAQNALSANDDYASEYAPVHWFGRTQECKTREEAVDVCMTWKEEREKRKWERIL